MSGQTDVDHPLCEECTDTLLDQLDTQLNITENECQNYKYVGLKLAVLEVAGIERQITREGMVCSFLLFVAVLTKPTAAVGFLKAENRNA